MVAQNNFFNTANNSTNDNKSFPTQRDLFLRSLFPGNHVDLVVSQDDDAEIVEIRSSIIYDITKERMLIIAQTSPPLLPSMVGMPLEITFICNVETPNGKRVLRTAYRTKLVGVLPNYTISRGQRETALVVNLPARLEVASLRMHFRVQPRIDYGMRVYWANDNLKKVINGTVSKFTKLMRHEFWLRDKHPQKLLQKMTDELRVAISYVYNKTQDVKEAFVHDLSEGGARLIHDRLIHLNPGDIEELILSWGDEIMEARAKIVHSGELSPESHPSRIYTAVQFVDLLKEDRKRLAGLMQEMMRKDLAARAAQEE